MNLKEAAEMALEALENVYGKGKRCEAAIKELRQALADEAIAPVREQKNKQWVDITDEEIATIHGQWDAGNLWKNWNYEHALAALIKEKNGGN